MGVRTAVSKNGGRKSAVFHDAKKTFFFGAENKNSHHWKEKPFFFKHVQKEFDESAVWMNYDVKQAVTDLR